MSELSITYRECLLGHEAILSETRRLCPLCELALYKKALFLACHKMRNLDHEAAVAPYNEAFF